MRKLVATPTIHKQPLASRLKDFTVELSNVKISQCLPLNESRGWRVCGRCIIRLSICGPRVKPHAEVVSSSSSREISHFEESCLVRSGEGEQPPSPIPRGLINSPCCSCTRSEFIMQSPGRPGLWA